ncbi:MAG: hypothetical protein P8X55_09770 [Desulfosarcinaceae bacterium]
MAEDIRDVAFIDHKDVIGLNFIKSGGPYVFRRHFRQGLRSHIMEVLLADDLEREAQGQWIGGLRRFPKALPCRMLRIFRHRLCTLANALGEIRRVKLAERYLTSEFLARSSEIVVAYSGPRGRDLLLCGLQEYVHGAIVDPWSILDTKGFLRMLYEDVHSLGAGESMIRERWLGAVGENGARFIRRIKQMVLKEGHVPDLAGVGNILITPSGLLKLVDINNISRVFLDSRIRVDDRGYPVCDKSIEALALLETKLLGRTVDPSEAVYRTFLDPIRRQEVKALEQEVNIQQRPAGGLDECD